MLSLLELNPFLREIHETADAALFQLDNLEREATKWLALQDQVDQEVRARAHEFDHDRMAESLQAAGRAQTHMFDVLEAFLAAWARLSLLLFPLGGADQVAARRKSRGTQLQRAFGLTESSPLNDRELRDSWMHFDERLDQAVAAGHYGNRQRFVRSTEAHHSITSTLRLVEVDTLVVHFRDRQGRSRSTALRDMRTHLDAIIANRASAWRHLRTALDQTTPPAS